MGNNRIQETVHCRIRICEAGENLPALHLPALSCRSGLPGRSCLLRTVGEVAEAGLLGGQGLAARTLQALLLMEHAEEGDLVEYLAARAVGRRRGGQCGVYHCPSNSTTSALLVHNLKLQAMARP